MQPALASARNVLKMANCVSANSSLIAFEFRFDLEFYRVKVDMEFPFTSAVTDSKRRTTSIFSTADNSIIIVLSKNVLTV